MKKEWRATIIRPDRETAALDIALRKHYNLVVTINVISNKITRGFTE